MTYKFDWTKEGKLTIPVPLESGCYWIEWGEKSLTFHPWPPPDLKLKSESLAREE